MKFLFKKFDTMNVWSSFGEIDIPKLEAFMESVKQGKRMEMVIREEIRWDTCQMRKYFEGPIVDFIKECMQQHGKTHTKLAVREGIKALHLGITEPDDFGLRHAISTKTLDEASHGLSSYQKWRKFLRDINDYCMDKFGHGLPTQDDTDVE